MAQQVDYDEAIDKFYDDMLVTVETNKTHHYLIIDDFNAKFGIKEGKETTI